MEKTINGDDYISLRLEFELCSDTLIIQDDKRYVKSNDN